MGNLRGGVGGGGGGGGGGADEVFGRHLVAPMHLDQTTGGAELTEVVSAGRATAAAPLR